MNIVEKTFEYPVPDERYHQTREKNKVGRVKYIGPDKTYVWVNSSTNKIMHWNDMQSGKLMYEGDMPLPANLDGYLVEVDVEKDPDIASLNTMYTSVWEEAIPDVTETIPGQDYKYVHDAFPSPAHAYEMTEIQYDPVAKSWVKPLPFAKPIVTWEMRLAKRDTLLTVADKNLSDDLPTSTYNTMVAYKQHLRDITEAQGVAWTATVPTKGTGYAKDDVLLVQDPAYKNTTVIDEVKITVTAVDADGGITEFSVDNKRALYHPEAATYENLFFVTNGGGSGAKVTLSKVKQVDPWKGEWKDNPLAGFAGGDPNIPAARKDDDNSDHLVDEIEDRDLKKYAHRTDHPNYIDVSDLLD